MYKAVILDLDDTLYEYESLNQEATGALRDYTCQRFAVSNVEFDRAFSLARAETKKVLGETGASHNRMLYCQKTLEYLGRRPVNGALDMYEVYWGYMLDHMALREGVMDMLVSCCRKGIKIGICSDLTAHIQHRKLKQLGIVDYIDAIVTSEEAGAEKPASVMFCMVLDKLKVDAKEALYIGDSLKKDVKGAIAEGIDALWFHDENDADYKTVASFDEIRGIIDGKE